MADNDEVTSAGTEIGDAALTRKRLLRDAGLLGVALVGGGSLGVGRGLAELTGLTASAAAASALILTPEQEEGPYYVALEKIRKNISLGRPGVPFTLRIKVVSSATGKPIKNAACDIWHCDASGVYSDESVENTVGQTWLRGVQLTNANGVAEFDSIYPGHYMGRATHIHVKVHIGGTKSGTQYSGGHVSHTGQLFFNDAISSHVYALDAYAADTAARVLDPADNVYTQQGGAKSLVALTMLGTSVADGFLGTVTLGVNPASTPSAVGGNGGAPPVPG
jgi:protocatechuate 3,4-dioxygenase beta subunit